MKTPSIGQIVHFVNESDEHQAAIITRLQPHFSVVDLETFGAGGEIRTVVRMDDAPTPKRGTWHWPEIVLILLLGLLFVGCASTETPTDPPPVHDYHAQVLQADKDWAWFASVGQPAKSDVAAVQGARKAYDKEKSGGDAKRTQKAAENYIGLVNSLMIPPLAAPPKRK